MVALGHSGSFGWLRSPRPYGGLRRGYGHRSLGRVITAVPLARAGPLDLVVAHLLDSVDVGPYRGEEAGELRTAAEPPQVSIGRVPLDADGVGGRIVGAARDLVALAVSRGTERERVRERTRRLLVVARGRLHAAALLEHEDALRERLHLVRRRRRLRLIDHGHPATASASKAADWSEVARRPFRPQHAVRAVRPALSGFVGSVGSTGARAARAPALGACGGDARSLSGSRSFAVGVGRRRSRDALGRREHERGVGVQGPRCRARRAVTWTSPRPWDDLPPRVPNDLPRSDQVGGARRWVGSRSG